MSGTAQKQTIQSWAGPSRTIPGLRDGAVDRDAAAGEGDDDLDFEVFDSPDPVTHGVGIDGVLNDVPEGAHYDAIDDSVYRRLLAGWRETVGDPSNEPGVLLEGVHRLFEFANDDYPAHLCLTSSGWKAGTGRDLEGQRYEYSLRLVRYDPEDDRLEPDEPLPVNFQTSVGPQEHGLVLPSGGPPELPFGAGTKFHTQTTYASPGEAVNRTMRVVSAALAALGKPRPDWDCLAQDSLKLWKAEVHHRIDRELMDSACGTLAKEYPDVAADAVDAAVGFLDSDYNRVRANAAGLLADLADAHPDRVEPVVPRAIELLDDADEKARYNATSILARVADEHPTAVEAAVDPLIEALDDDFEYTRSNACWELGYLGAEAALGPLRGRAPDDPSEEVRQAAKTAIEAIESV